MQPWLSVVMPTFNGGRFLRAALDSIVSQNDAPIEIIAVDDGSTDDTLDILREYSARLPLSVVSRPHSGNWVAGTNVGLIRASGEWVCFLHQDDGWLPNRLARLHALTESFRDVVLFLHASRYVDSEGTCVGTWSCALPRLGRPLPPDRVLERLLVQNFIAIPAPLFRREAAVRIGGMNERLWYTADWDFWLSLAGQGSVYHHPEALSWFRIHPMSQTVRAGRSASDFRQQMLEVLDRHLAAFAARWPGRCARVTRAARFSVEVNAHLKARFHGDRLPLSPLARQAAFLGPQGLYRFLRDSRILDRVRSRLKARDLLPTP